MQREQKAYLFSVQTQQENVAFAERKLGGGTKKQQEVMAVSGANLLPKTGPAGVS